MAGTRFFDLVEANRQRSEQRRKEKARTRAVTMLLTGLAALVATKAKK
jgi:hypothetical protein